MRRKIGWAAILLLIGVGFAVLAAIVLTNRALAAARQGPAALCLEHDEAEQIAAFTLPTSQRDLIVERSANFALGVPTSLWWHLRGALIVFTYRTFWSEARRRDNFARIVPNMRPCPAHRRQKADRPIRAEKLTLGRRRSLRLAPTLAGLQASTELHDGLFTEEARSAQTNQEKVAPWEWVGQDIVRHGLTRQFIAYNSPDHLRASRH